ncbi:MAG: response regulator [Tildeniella nuda ZEHNDER 1965/U140]|jgi:CheY-like chemotaxis protein|nr:response regulator [Tildeniella nuda ZEHNDER 1965/U140]
MNLNQNSRIIIVDDIADNLLLLQLVLEAEGYRIELAMSGSAALSSICASPPDLVLLDVMMSGMNGFEVTQQLRQSKHFSMLPIVLITADREIDLDRALAAGANDVICKPVDLDELLVRVSAWCH